MTLPLKIAEIVAEKPYAEENIGLSGARVLMFDDYVLKIEDKRKTDGKTVGVMRWLDGKIPAPKVICCETDDKYRYLLMSRIKGKMACDPVYLANAEKLAEMLANALKTLWAADVSDCPRHRDFASELAAAAYRVKNNLINLDNVNPATFSKDGFENPPALLTWLENHVPAVYEPVLSHGDFCLPNVFFDNGRLAGFIDLDDAGVGDKWRDIALCYRSLNNNLDGVYGGKVYAKPDGDFFFEKLGMEPDWEKIRYYLLLDELY